MTRARGRRSTRLTFTVHVSRDVGLEVQRLAKAHVRYSVHRPDEHGLRQYRELWDRDGRISKQAAYARLDDIGHGDFIYRLTLSPHPERQDAGHQLDLRAWTRDMLARLEREAGQRLEWFAVTHEHRDHRHVHAVVVSRGRLDAGQFRAMREAGDASARAQQRQLQQQRQAPSGPGRAPERGREVLPTRRGAFAREVGR
jgi:hypothetical protein